MRLSFKKQPKIVERGKLLAVEGAFNPSVLRQIELLSESLTFAGFTVAVATFPQKETNSDKLLHEYEESSLTPEAQAILHVLNFFEAKSKIESWLAQGTIVIVTNYYVSTAAQAAASATEAYERVRLLRFVNTMASDVFAVPKPDLHVILDMSVDRVGKLRQKPEVAPSNTVIEQTAAYKQLAKVYPQTRLVPCAVGENFYSDEELHNVVWQLIRRIVFKNKMS